MEILATIGYIVLCVLMFSLAIAIHEFGHFIVALKLGLKVERFSIGFGPALWKKTYKGVEYRISAIPLGGYVSIPDVDPEGTKAIEGEKKAAEPKAKIPAWKELLVAVAGPAMNVVLAVVIAIILSLIPSARFGQLSTEIGGFAPGSVSKAAGLQKGDIIIAVGDRPVATWSELQTEVQISNGKPTEFRVKRPRALEERRTVTIGAGEVESLPLVDSVYALAPIIEGFWTNSVAAAAGFKAGDRILSVDGEPVLTIQEAEALLQEAGIGQEVTFGVRRGEETLSVAVKPVLAKMAHGEHWITGQFIGAYCATNAFVPLVSADAAGLRFGDRVLAVNGREVASAEAARAALVADGTNVLTVVSDIPSAAREYDEVTVTIAPQRNPTSGAFLIEATSLPSETGSVAWMPDRNPFKQLAWDAGSIFRVLKALVTPKEAGGTSKAVGGPILIAEGIYRSMRRDFNDGLGFLRFLNTNLAIMNLLPIPVLDGGLILFALIAIVFRRRVPEKIVGALSMGFMYLLLGLMGLLIFSDSLRSWRIHTAEDPADKIEIIVPAEDGYAL